MQPFSGLPPSLGGVPPPPPPQHHHFQQQHFGQQPPFVYHGPPGPLGSGHQQHPQQRPVLEEPPLPGTALAEELDQKILIQLRDGRKLIGMLRSFDQFANLVVEDSVERIIVGEQYGDVPMGLQLIRGENVVLLGRIDPDREVPPNLTRVSEAEIKRAQKGERDLNKLKATMRARMDFLDLE